MQSTPYILAFLLCFTYNASNSQQQDINIKGGLVPTSIANGDTSPSITNGTDFGNVEIGGGNQINTFVIQNIKSGGSPSSNLLTINNISISGTNASEFVITNSISTVTRNTEETFTITFTPTATGLRTATVTILNDDPDENPSTFVIQGNAVQLFYDSDNDGVYDNFDIDDDNDGIIDSSEELSCNSSPTASAVNYKFLEETFGTGDRTTINTTHDETLTDYCYEDGTNSTNTTDCPQLDNNDLSDGEYVVYYKAGDGDGTNDTPNTEVASWADQYWYTGGDHTGDIQGRMAMFNASYEPEIFYTGYISGALPNVPITYSFWALNLDTTLAPDIANRLRPNIKVEFQDMSGNVLTNQATMLPAIITTGDISPSINGDSEGSWHQFTASLTLAVNEFQVIFTNNNTGGLGNDLALDDIEIRQTLCDLDNDGIADIFDLDSDNDGIPDIVEAGLGHLSNGTGTIDVSWIDTNGDGLHDSAAGHTILDSDGDGVPNYQDLDSDNDCIFDVDESGAGNSGDPNFQNGDGDITGDGVGDGLETEAFREKDVYGSGIPEYYGDGILDIYDFHSIVNNYTDAYGNDSQGMVTGNVYYVKDTDLDGIPDYIDITSDGSTFDIDGTLYASLDADNDGDVDGSTDTDGDGLLDAFDTNDSLFGSPRDLDRKLHLYFDGRNDYGVDSNVISSGPATIMTFVRSNGDNTNNDNRIIAGQDDFYLRINDADNTLSVIVEGSTLTSTTAITDGKWTHIAATTELGNTVLYINGVVEAIDSSGGINDASNLFIGRSSTGNQYYNGYLDELRIFDKALTSNELRKMIYQELKDNSGNIRGEIIPIDITDYDLDSDVATPLPWSNMKRYFRMDTYNGNIIDDYSTVNMDTGTGAKIYNNKIIEIQSAPVPFVTQQSGNLSTALDITADGINGKDAVSYNWSIIKISHDAVTYNANQKHIGVIVDELDADFNPIEFSIENDSELNISWYLGLNGFIDLDGESQLVQGPDSSLDVGSSGKLERDQQGTNDLFTYNYWSSPVGLTVSVSSNPNKYSYTVPDILKDGLTSSNPLNINFLTSGYNGSTGIANISGASIADYWIWKYANTPGNPHSEWQHVRSTGTILAGEGFTMKGVENTETSFNELQNYVFKGKPNNGAISIAINTNSKYLVGNPYPSALDADEFIKDNLSHLETDGRNTNGNIINGALYFWDHFASKTHTLAEYEGGYATYTLMGGVKAVSNDARMNATLGVGTITPQRYIPISQGFFVSTIDDGLVSLTQPIVGGDIVFKNSQRVFKKEGVDSTSSFLKSSGTKSSTTKSNEDIRQKIRLMFDSPRGYHRQLLVGVDENASNDFDAGYDAPLNETNKEDIYWSFDDGTFNIQAVNNFDLEQKLPLGVKIFQEGLATIKIDELENINSNLEIYLHDIELDIYQDLRLSHYEVFLAAGTYTERFEITFSKGQSLSLDELNDSDIQTYYSNAKQSFILHNPILRDVTSIELINILGQSVYKLDKISIENYQEFKTRKINSGTYIIKTKTIDGLSSKKVMIK